MPVQTRASTMGWDRYALRSRAGARILAAAGGGAGWQGAELPTGAVRSCRAAIASCPRHLPAADQ